MESRFAEPSPFESVQQRASARVERVAPASSDHSSDHERPWQTKRFAAAILLGGTVRTSGFGAAVKRSLLDLPIDDGQTLLNYWAYEFSKVRAALGLSRILVRVVIGRNCFAPQTIAAVQDVQLAVERDPVEFRGTGGVLRDLAQVYDDDDLLLVAVANQLSGEPLASRIQRMWGGGDARLLVGPHMEPTGLLLIRCGCLRDIAMSGFVDLKEQALPAIARRHRVYVVAGGSATHSIRQWADYLSALRHRHQTASEATESAYDERWQPRFSVVEKGARVDSTAGVHDSVVLAGGRVEAKATLVRSLVAPGGVVLRGQTVVDSLVTESGISQ